MIRPLKIACACAVLVASGIPAFAAGAPSQLHNKTVSVSMSISVDAKAADGSVTNMPRTVDRQLYISSKGRVFGRANRQVGRLATQTDSGPERTASAFRFEGNRMIGVIQFISGAGQMVITFAPGFQSCTATVLMGREAGKSLTFKGLNGKTYTATGPARVSGVSCAIRDGNPFG